MHCNLFQCNEANCNEMKIIAIGWNYPKHNEEMENARNARPVIFCKPETALIKDGKPFFLPDFSDCVEYETELVVRINRLGKNIAEKFAGRYYAEASIGIDFTARDLQKQLREAGSPWDICKGFDNSAPVGKFLNLENIGKDVQDLHFRLDINGTTVQKGYSGNMIFPVDKIISEASRYFTVKTGDLIFTGTPECVGKVNIGDRLQGYIEDELVLDFYVR